jgi:molybdate transport system permease protein
MTLRMNRLGAGRQTTYPCEYVDEHSRIMDLSDSELTAILLSLKVAVWAMAASLPFGILAALLLARGRFWGKSLLNGMVHLPLILPPVVTGYLLLLFFGRRGPGGAFLEEHFGIIFSFRWTGAALACAVMGFPLLVRAIRLSIEAVDRGLEEAAATLGARPAWVFLTVTLPLILPGIIAGMILSFAKAMGEFGATITFVSNIPGETQTLPSAIYTYTQVPGGDGPALRLTVISVILSMAALLASEILARRIARRIGAAP